MSKGCVYLVGAGPGDPGLITVRGRELLSLADVVVYDYLASPRLLSWARPDAEMIYVGKQAGAHTLGQEQISDLLAERAGKGATVVRLKGGDPFVFGRGGEEALALVKAGISFEVVPGITAGIAAAAYAGIPVTHRKLASNFGLITGHETPNKAGSSLDFQALANWRGPLALYLEVAHVAEICEGRMDHGLCGETPAALIRWGTTSRQQVLVATVRNLAKQVADAGLEPPAMIIIGEVVRLRDKLKWFESRPLFGRRIVVTRARAQVSSLSATLERLGAEVIEMPTIRILPPDDPGPLDKAVAKLEAFDWIVFTSANGVDGFFSALARAGLDSRALGSVRICTIGPATAGRLGQFGLRSDLQPKQFLSTEVVEALAAQEDLAGARILCPRADIAPPDMVDALAARGAVVREVTAYRTAPDCGGAEEVVAMMASDEIDWITFTSSSTVKNFFDVIKPETVRLHGARLASIGPATSAALGRLGFSPAVQADPHTIEGLVNAILAQEANIERQQL